MSRSAGGAYTAPPGTDAVSLASISSASYNTLIDDLESEITDSWSRSGKGAALADMAMGGHKLTGLAAATLPGEAVRYEQLTGLQASDATLTALAAFSTLGLVTLTAADTFAGRSIAVAGTGLAVTNPAGTAGNPTITIDPAAVVAAGGGTPAAAATQAEQEAAASLTAFVSPGRQHFHPTAAKCWAYVTVSGGVPTLAKNHNITSITDTATGVLTITIGTDFSDASWASLVSAAIGQNDRILYYESKAAGSIVLRIHNNGSATYSDPTSWDLVGFGDFA